MSRRPEHKSVAELALLAVLLVAVTQPELRALLLLADALGLEWLLLSAWIYARHAGLPVAALAARGLARFAAAASPRKEWALPVFYGYPRAALAAILRV